MLAHISLQLCPSGTTYLSVCPLSASFLSRRIASNRNWSGSATSTSAFAFACPCNRRQTSTIFFCSAKKNTILPSLVPRCGVQKSEAQTHHGFCSCLFMTEQQKSGLPATVVGSVSFTQVSQSSTPEVVLRSITFSCTSQPTHHRCWRAPRETQAAVCFCP